MKHVRRLVLIDIANLVGSGKFGTTDASIWRAGLLSAFGYNPGDVWQVATGPGTATEVAFEFEPIRVAIAKGYDGADYALSAHLEDVKRVAKNFDEVIVASGDHHFYDAVKSLLLAGVKVTLAIGKGNVHSSFSNLPVVVVRLGDEYETAS